MASTITVRKFTSFTVTEVDAFGTTLQSTVIGTGFTYDTAGNPVSGTVNSISFTQFGTGSVVVYTQKIAGLVNVTMANLAAFVPPGNGLWYDPSNVDLLSAYDARLVYTEVFATHLARIQGGYLDDKLQGTAFDDIITGANGNDRIFGNGGQDQIFGEDGNDSIFGDMSGASRFYGGIGNDVIIGSDFADVLDGGIGVDGLYAGLGADQVFGGSGNDGIGGGAGNDRLYGDAGDDRIQGDAGDDRLEGESGDDRVSGGANDDTLFGGAGDDVVVGSAGNDALSGDGGDDSVGAGTGDDLIKFADGTDSVIGGTGADTFVFALGGAVGRSYVADFAAVEDFIVMGDALFNTGVAHSAQENYAFFLGHSVDTLKGTTFTGTDGNQVYFRQLHFTDLTAANFLATDGTATQFL